MRAASARLKMNMHNDGSNTSSDRSSDSGMDNNNHSHNKRKSYTDESNLKNNNKISKKRGKTGSSMVSKISTAEVVHFMQATLKTRTGKRAHLLVEREAKDMDVAGATALLNKLFPEEARMGDEQWAMMALRSRQEQAVHERTEAATDSSDVEAMVAHVGRNTNSEWPCSDRTRSDLVAYMGEYRAKRILGVNKAAKKVKRQQGLYTIKPMSPFSTTQEEVLRDKLTVLIPRTRKVRIHPASARPLVDHFTVTEDWEAAPLRANTTRTVFQHVFQQVQEVVKQILTPLQRVLASVRKECGDPSDGSVSMETKLAECNERQLRLFESSKFFNRVVIRRLIERSGRNFTQAWDAMHGLLLLTSLKHVLDRKLWLRMEMYWAHPLGIWDDDEGYVFDGGGTHSIERIGMWQTSLSPRCDRQDICMVLEHMQA